MQVLLFYMLFTCDMKHIKNLIYFMVMMYKFITAMKILAFISITREDVI